jgi:hypothetical protein
MTRGREPTVVSTRRPAKGRARMIRACPVIAAALGLTGCGGDASNEPARAGTAKGKPAAITVPLEEENHSGSRGEATLRPSEGGPTGPGQAGGNGTKVTIRLSTNTGASHPAHIHDVTCQAYRGMSSYGARLKTVQDTLNAVDDGESETIVGVDMSARTNGHHSINVHETAYPYDVIACGDIPNG